MEKDEILDLCARALRNMLSDLFANNAGESYYRQFGQLARFYCTVKSCGISFVVREITNDTIRVDYRVPAGLDGPGGGATAYVPTLERIQRDEKNR